MQIIIHRRGTDYGPYPVAAVLQHLSQGKLLLNDLARDAASPGGQAAALRPLAKVLTAAGVVLPSLAAVGLLQRAQDDLRSFGAELVLPFHQLFSRQTFNDARLLYLAMVGLLPAALLSLSPGISTAYWAIALYFSGLWSVFFYSCFKTPQVERWVCFLCFFFTGLVSTPLLLFIQLVPPWVTLYSMAGSGRFLTRAAGMFLAIGPNEELCKAAILFLLVRQPGKLLIPQTVVFYGMISGLGFGIYEGVHYQQGINRAQGVDLAYLLNVARLTSLPFLHAVWTGLAGYFIAFAGLYPGRRVGLWILAIAIPASFHATYDTFGWGLPGIGAAFLSVVLLTVYLSNSSRWQQRLTAP